MNVNSIERATGLVVWSPDATRFLLNKKDAIKTTRIDPVGSRIDRAGTYQMFVGNAGAVPVSITTAIEPGLHKMQPTWHPSGKWLLMAIERGDYAKPWYISDALNEGWLQCGLWTNMWACRPDGSEAHPISDFGDGRANGYTGVAFTPDGSKGVWAEIVGYTLADMMGVWRLMIADFDTYEGRFYNPRDITPPGARWIEPGNFHPDGKTLLISSDIGMIDPQGMNQYTVDIETGAVKNLTPTLGTWDEHGVFSPDGTTILFMSSLPYLSDPAASKTLGLKTEFMLMDTGTGVIQQLTHFNTLWDWTFKYKEANFWRGSCAANGAWSPDGKSVTVLNLFFPTYEAWTIKFAVSAGASN